MHCNYQQNDMVQWRDLLPSVYVSDTLLMVACKHSIVSDARNVSIVNHTPKKHLVTSFVIKTRAMFTFLLYDGIRLTALLTE